MKTAIRWPLACNILRKTRKELSQFVASGLITCRVESCASGKIKNWYDAREILDFARDRILEQPPPAKRAGAWYRAYEKWVMNSLRRIQGFADELGISPKGEGELSLPKYLTSGEAAKSLEVSAQTIRRWYVQGKLRGELSKSGRLRIAGDDVKSILEKMNREASAMVQGERT